MYYSKKYFKRTLAIKLFRFKLSNLLVLILFILLVKFNPFSLSLSYLFPLPLFTVILLMLFEDFLYFSCLKAYYPEEYKIQSKDNGFFSGFFIPRGVSARKEEIDFFPYKYDVFLVHLMVAYVSKRRFNSISILCLFLITLFYLIFTFFK